MESSATSTGEEAPCAHQHHEQQLEADGLSPVERFLAGRSILVTGSSGFIGKVLLEKLLRCYPHIGHIYLLLRTKRNQAPHERLHSSILSAPLFDTLRRRAPHLLAKCSVIAGDIAEPRLGLSAHDEQRLIDADVSVIFNSAATVKFDEPLRTSVQLNLVATQSLVELARKLPNLASVCHVSTAYANSDLVGVDIEERVYPGAECPLRVIQMAQWMEEDTMQLVQRKLLANKPNTYTYTKALAERLLAEHARDLPLAIVRPSIVVATWREPIRGWVDNVNGPTGLLLAIGKGLLRTLCVKKSARADLIPVDVCVNLMIAAAWKTAHTRRPAPPLDTDTPSGALDQGLPVYHCTSGQINPITWGTMETMLLPIIRQYPSKQVLRYPGGTFKESKRLDTLYRIFLHYLPALLVDTLCLCTGTKPLLLTLYDKIHRACAQLSAFCNTDWSFNSNNMLALYQQLDPRDQAKLPMDLRQLNWDTYSHDYILGARTYVLKEEPRSLPQARKSLNRAYYLDWGLTLLLVATLCYFFAPPLTNLVAGLLGTSGTPPALIPDRSHSSSASVWSRASSAFVEEMFSPCGTTGASSHRLLTANTGVEAALMGAR